MTTARWVPTRQEYARRRRKVASIALAIVSALALTTLAGKHLDTKYDYTCPQMNVVAQRGDTLSSITERHCQGHTLQASWDIAKRLGTANIREGQLIQLGGK
jgi:hypothetical protein